MTDKDIVTYFVKNLQATYEHWFAKSKGGEDEQGNIIVLCGKCNRRRSNLPYPFFLRFEPQMMQNLQKQFNKVMTFIKHGKLIGYDDYPLVMKQNVLEGSDNLIRLKIKDYLDFRRERAARKVDKAQAKLTKDELKLNAANEKVAEFDEKIKELEAQIRELRAQRRPYQEEYNEVKKVYNISRANTESLQAELDSAQGDIARDRETNASLKYKRRKLNK